MVKVVHTADWQLGKPFVAFGAEAGVLLKQARLDVVARIADVVRAEKADLVVVAGDIFDANTVGSDTVVKACGLLAAISAPVYLLPGNHDPLDADSVFSRPDFVRAKPANVHVLDSTAPVVVAGGKAVLLPAPAMRKKVQGDASAAITGEAGSAAGPDAICVGVAHGSVVDFAGGEPGESHNQIDAKRAEQAGLDYLALGDWHGVLQVGPRTWYAGAPEPTGVSDRLGAVLVVELDGRGLPPRVRPVEVGRLRWVEVKASMQAPEDVDALGAKLDALPSPADTVLELVLDGALGIADAHRLAVRCERAGDAFLYVRERGPGVVDAPTGAELDTFHADGFVGPAFERLRHAAAGGDPDARRALVQLFRLHAEEVQP